MIQSPRYIGTYLLFAFLIGSALSMDAQELSIKNSCLSMAGNSSSVHQGSNHFFIQESIGQNSVIGTNTVQGATLRQGFIQPQISTAKAVEIDPLKIQVFPNPTTDRLTIKALNAEGIDVDISIYDMSGRLIVNMQDNLLKEVSISLSSFSTGIYVLRVMEAERLFTTNIQKL